MKIAVAGVGYVGLSLAVLLAQEGDKRTAGDLLLQALEMSQQRNLALEAVSMLCEDKRYAEALAAIDRLPLGVRRIGRMKMLRIEALLGIGETREAERLLKQPIVLTDVKEGEVTPSRLWFWMCACKKAEEEGTQVTEAVIEEMSRTVTPPRHLDFRMK